MQLRSWQARVAKGGQRALLRLIQEQDKELAKIVLRAAKDAEKIIASIPGDTVGEIVRQAMYQQRRTSLLEVAVQMWGDDVPATILKNLSTATQMSANANRQILQVLARATPRYAAILSDSMLVSARSTFQDMRSRLLNEIDLSPSVFKNRALMMGRIDNIVNSGIGLGQSAREIAGAVRGYINPSVMGGQRYAAMRLGRTELNNAFHTTSIRSYIESPYVIGVKWNLSGSHKVSDECNEFADHEDGMGEGVFEKTAVPFKPHPMCFCFLTPITPTVDEFADRLTSGEYDCGRL